MMAPPFRRLPSPLLRRRLYHPFLSPLRAPPHLALLPLIFGGAALGVSPSITKLTAAAILSGADAAGASAILRGIADLLLLVSLIPPPPSPRFRLTLLLTASRCRQPTPRCALLEVGRTRRPPLAQNLTSLATILIPTQTLVEALMEMILIVSLSPQTTTPPTPTQSSRPLLPTTHTCNL